MIDRVMAERLAELRAPSNVSHGNSRGKHEAMRSTWWIVLLSLFGCREQEGRRREVGDFGMAKLFVLSNVGGGSDFGGGSFGGLGLELVTNADWITGKWSRRQTGHDAYKLALDARGLNLFVREAGGEDVWSDVLAPGDWSEIVNINDRATAWHRDVYAYDRQFRFAAPTQGPDRANPPHSAPLTNRITAKGSLKAWAAYTDAGDGRGLKLLDGLNVASVSPESEGLAARVVLAAPIDGTVAVEAHYNHEGLENPYRLIVTRRVDRTYVEIEHYDVARQKVRDQRAPDHGVTYVFVYGRQD
jgi:hypothetical protein